MRKVIAAFTFIVIPAVALSAYAGEFAELKKLMIDARKSFMFCWTM